MVWGVGEALDLQGLNSLEACQEVEALLYLRTCQHPPKEEVL